MTRPRGTDGSLLPSLPWTLAALAVSLSAHIPYLPIWITLAFLGCAAWRYAIERQRRLLPTTWIRAALALGCFLGVLGTYSSISGVGPGSALLAIMAALKLLETRKRRDQFVLLFLSIFLVMSSLLREQFIWSLPYMLVAVLIILTAWLRMAAGEATGMRQSLLTSGRLLLYAAPLAIAMWVFFPRLSNPFWGVPIDTSQAASGLSETMSPGDISSLSLSDEVAFRVSFDGDVPPPLDRYWRGLVLTRFNGRTWSGREPSISRSALEQIEVRGEPVNYEITLEPTRQQWLFAMDMPTQWSLARSFMGPQQQLARITPIDQRIAYTVTSYTDYRVGTDMPTLYRNWYSELPDEGNQRTRELAREMRAAANTDREFVNAILSMFNEQDFYYTLKPPALGRDPVDRFLFDTRRGFCEHYASAFSVMLRSVGIPTRVVLGYQGGEINPLGGHLIVRQSDAHAWTEVWLEGLGWARVDPTAAVAPERVQIGTRAATRDGIGEAWGFTAASDFMHNVTLTWDAINAKWNEWILGYGPEAQRSFMRWLGMDEPSGRKMFLTLVLIVIGLIMAISLVIALRYRAPRPDAAARLYARFIRQSGLEPETGETARLFAARVREVGQLPAATVDEITAAYLDARYGRDDAGAFGRLERAIAAMT
jgi:transglutaminase-like putative cysteine protease